MIPWFKKLVWDESAFERYSRAFFLGVGALALSGQLPDWVPQWIAGPLLALGGLIGAGDRNLSLPELRKEERADVARVAVADERKVGP